MGPVELDRRVIAASASAVASADPVPATLRRGPLRVAIDPGTINRAKAASKAWRAATGNPIGRRAGLAQSIAARALDPARGLDRARSGLPVGVRRAPTAHRGRADPPRSVRGVSPTRSMLRQANRAGMSDTAKPPGRHSDCRSDPGSDRDLTRVRDPAPGHRGRPAAIGHGRQASVRERMAGPPDRRGSARMPARPTGSCRRSCRSPRVRRSLPVAARSRRPSPRAAPPSASSSCRSVARPSSRLSSTRRRCGFRSSRSRVAL